LVAYDHTEPAALVKHPVTFVPDEVEVIDVFLIGVIEPDLVRGPIVFELPVRWRGDDEMDRFFGNFPHVP